METLITHLLQVEQPEPGREAVPSPGFAVSYNSKAISDSIAPLLQSMIYTDNSDGTADQLDIVLEDSDGNFKRLYYPDKGARLVARLGWPDQMLACGEFEIHEVHQTGPPSVVSLRALAAGLTKSVRTKRSKAFENQSLAQIAGHFASSHGLTVVGKIRPVTIERVTQASCRDLKFLRKLALEYGYVFSLRGKQLVFTDVYLLQSAKAVLKLGLADVSTYEFTDKLTGTYEAAEVRYHNPKHRRLIKGRAAASGLTTSGDTLVMRRKSEDQTQADAQARAALHWHNTSASECSITMVGNPVVVSGVLVELLPDLAGALAGNWYITTSGHTIDRGSGYETTFSAKHIRK